jgi:probable HAF family extracellular repeat protein
LFMHTTALRNTLLFSTVLLAMGTIVGCSGGGGGSTVVPANPAAPSLSQTGKTTPSPAFTSAPYSITNVGTLSGFDAGSDAFGINDNGVVVGRADSSDTNVLPIEEAIKYSNGALVGLGGLPGYSSSDAYAINLNGTAAGSIAYPGNGALEGTFYAVTFDAQGVHVLGGPACIASYSSYVARAINASGNVVGWGDLVNDQPEALLYTGGTAIALGIGYAFAINDSGEIVGETQSAQAVIFSTSSPPKSIGTLGTTSDAEAINDKGQIVGNFQTGAVIGNVTVAHAFLYSNGQMKDLGVPAGGVSSDARAINNEGAVVGVWYDSSGTSHAFIYQNGVMTDLNTLLPANSGWTLQDADGVNDQGDIVGSGTINGTSRGFLLRPT